MVNGEGATSAEASGWKGIAVGWLARQEVTTVLLFAILGSIVYLSYYAITTAVPAHLESIQQGYQSQAKQFDATLQLQSNTFERTMTRMADSFDKNMERALQRADARQARNQ